ncbi:MAG: epimerase [Deltaproteobacteria bacterium]|nr:epimerase [Deltaproteobacteria bacterium]
MRILLTGGAGFIGSHLLDTLRDQGVEVTVVDDFNDFYAPKAKRANIEPHMGTPGFDLVEGDIREESTWARLDPSAGWTAVIHIAARAGVRPSLLEPQLYVSTNVDGTAAALQWASSAPEPLPFVLASSSSVYGDANSVPFCEETAVLQPVSPYGASKVAAEELVETWVRAHGMRAAALRFFTVYGPRQRPDLAIHKFARKISRGEPIPVFGDGSSARDYTHVQDVVQGALAALKNLLDGTLNERVYNLGSDRSISLDTMISVVEEAVGRRAVIDRQPNQPGDVRRTWADLGRSQRDLGYAPTVRFEDGVADFVRWLRSQ